MPFSWCNGQKMLEEGREEVECVITSPSFFNGVEILPIISPGYHMGEAMVARLEREGQEHALWDASTFVSNTVDALGYHQLAGVLGEGGESVL